MTMQQRPTLTPEEIAVLQGHGATLATAKSVLDDLEAIGVDVADHQALHAATEKITQGLLDRFSSTQYVPQTARRARAK